MKESDLENQKTVTLTFVGDCNVTGQIVNFDKEEYAVKRGQLPVSNHIPNINVDNEVKLVVEDCIDYVVENENVEFVDLLTKIKMEFKDFQSEIRSKDLQQAGKILFL